MTTLTAQVSVRVRVSNMTLLWSLWNICEDSRSLGLFICCTPTRPERKQTSRCVTEKQFTHARRSIYTSLVKKDEGSCDLLLSLTSSNTLTKKL